MEKKNLDNKKYLTSELKVIGEIEKKLFSANASLKEIRFLSLAFAVVSVSFFYFCLRIIMNITLNIVI